MDYFSYDIDQDKTFPDEPLIMTEEQLGRWMRSMKNVQNANWYRINSESRLGKLLFGVSRNSC